MTEERIFALTARGAKRWTKGNFDRLYVSAEALGLECTYYKTGSISSAKFNGHEISNSRAAQYKSYKSYIDVATGEAHTNATYDEYKRAFEAFIA